LCFVLGGSSLGLLVGNMQSPHIGGCAEVVEETVLETSDSGVIMLASLPDSSSHSVSHEPQTAFVVSPVCDDAANRIRLEYSQPLLQNSQRIESRTGEILRVSLTGSNELRSNRSLEALCNAADSELKNIGHQVASDKKLGRVKDTARNSRCLNQPTYVMNSVVAPSSQFVLPAFRLESDNSASEAVLIMPKPVAVSRSSHLDFSIPAHSYPLSTAVGIGNSSVQCPSLVAEADKMRAASDSGSGMQSSGHDSAKLGHQSFSDISAAAAVRLSRRHTCRFCGRVCAKPSVLQKHVRTHTGERPFPCQSCGLRFKTKSNLYKHCKSRAHSRTHLHQTSSATESLSADDEAVSSASGCKTAASKDEQVLSCCAWTNRFFFKKTRSYLTIQYKICKAPCCRGFRGAGEQDS